MMPGQARGITSVKSEQWIATQIITIAIQNWFCVAKNCYAFFPQHFGPCSGTYMMFSNIMIRHFLRYISFDILSCNPYLSISMATFIMPWSKVRWIMSWHVQNYCIIFLIPYFVVAVQTLDGNNAVLNLLVVTLEHNVPSILLFAFPCSI